MPNWVRNIVHAVDENVDFKDFTDDEGNFTFEKIIPMPDDIFRGPIGQKEQELYGKKNWYDWSIAHWGTKWDAHCSEIDGRTVKFETAWSCPTEVLVELGKKVGGILVFYADEGISENSGAFFVSKRGKIVNLDCNDVLQGIVHGRADIEDGSSVSDFIWALENEEEDDDE